MTVYVSILNTRSTDYRQRAGLPKENTPKYFRNCIRVDVAQCHWAFHEGKTKCDEWIADLIAGNLLLWLVLYSVSSGKKLSSHQLQEILSGFPLHISGAYTTCIILHLYVLIITDVTIRLSLHVLCVQSKPLFLKYQDKKILSKMLQA